MASRSILSSLKRTTMTPIAFRGQAAMPTMPIVARAFHQQRFVAAAAAPHAKHEESHGHGAGADHGDHGHHGGVEYEGLTLTPPNKWQTYGAHFFGGLMWFWIIYRFKNDYKVFLGLEHPWDGHHAHADEHHEEAAHH